MADHDQQSPVARRPRLPDELVTAHASAYEVRDKILELIEALESLAVDLRGSSGEPAHDAENREIEESGS